MGMRHRLKESFVAGIILVGPLLVTLYVLRLLVNWSLQFINPVVAGTELARYTGNSVVIAQIVAVIIILGTITVLGFLAQWSVGHRVFGNLGRAINIVPLVSTLYGSVRQVATSLVERDSQFESVVLVEHPRLDVYSIGLVTNEGIPAVDSIVGEETVAVFVPNSPNPTAGKLVMVPQAQVYDTEMSVRQGMRLVLTTGIGTQESRVEQYVDTDQQVTVDHSNYTGRQND